jgi:hypothetical protein
MIVKVRAANDKAIESWRYFDGAEGVHWSSYNSRDESGWNRDLVIEDVQYVEAVCGSHDSKHVLITFTSDMTGSIEILCNTEVYLMNNSGKTIEKLI